MTNGPDAMLKTEVLAKLAAIIAERRTHSAETSYTAKLLSQGMEKCAKKLGEEAVEAALAAMTGDKEHLTSEAADLLYHLIVVLELSDISLDKVMSELESRFAMGGLEEKAARSPD